MRLISLTVLGLALCISARGQELVELEEQAIRSAVQTVAPSLVRIDTVGGLEQVGDVLFGEGPTTGLIVSPDGHIISSTFNFLRQPTSILVTLADGRKTAARVVARDQSRKLVLLKIDADQLPIAEAVARDEIVVGQTAIAVGRTIAADKPNVSVGIVSARERIWGKAIQTDAKISPSNYGGPLIDLRGRVFGILVPLSPNSQHEMAGAEWYDGGIGFAVPLADVYAHLDRLKAGEDLHPGLLGVTLKPGDIYSLPAEIAACQPKSPAFQAGLRIGDTIVEVNGRPIVRQSQLRHALGPLYAGDKASVAVMRAGQRQEFSIELVEEIPPYEHPFLGLLPQPDVEAGEAGVGIRYVYADSPAATAGITVGDRVTKVSDKDVKNAAELRTAIAAFEPGKEVSLTLLRAGQPTQITATLAKLPVTYPPEDAVKSAAVAGQGKGATSVIKLPEEQKEAILYVPTSYKADTPSSLLISLAPPGEFKPEELATQWGEMAERYRMIVVAPRAALPNMWLPTETQFIRKVVDHLIGNYKIDRTRIVVHGRQASGAMAFLTAFRLRDVIRGAVTVDAPLPMLLARPPDNDPVERLAFIVVLSAESTTKSRITDSADLLKEMRYPVIVEELPGQSNSMPALLLDHVSQWIDSLDRI